MTYFSAFFISHQIGPIFTFHFNLINLLDRCLQIFAKLDHSVIFHICHASGQHIHIHPCQAHITYTILDCCLPGQGMLYCLVSTFKPYVSFHRRCLDRLGRIEKGKRRSRICNAYGDCIQCISSCRKGIHNPFITGCISGNQNVFAWLYKHNIPQ